MRCYYWLGVIFPENEAYREHSEELLEKANIVVAFQDSPCETREERYEGIEPRMFTRAVDALKFNYVSVVDYGQMAGKAVKRCVMLGEVVESAWPAISGADEEAPRPGGSADLERPGDEKLTSWSAGLGRILDEIAQSPTGLTKGDFAEVFDEVLDLNDKTVRFDSGFLIAQFAEAAFSALDPYTVIVWPRQTEDFDKMMTNEFTGIGIEITKEEGLLKVASLLPDTPAYASGLDAGDVIVKVDGVETRDMSLMCAVKSITGPKGTQVTLTVTRPSGDVTRRIPIIRDSIVVPTIRGWQRTAAGRWRYMLDDAAKIGYVRLTGFSEKTAADFEDVLGKLESRGLKALVLDLRFNSGGLLDSAVDVADKFLSSGLIVSTRPRGIGTWSLAKRAGTHPDYPLVVLINSGSASASEIVAGALADEMHGRAVLVGERTHGKGSVQGITAYPQGGAQLKYTMAYYHLPSGQKVESRQDARRHGDQKWGVEPNVKVELNSDELKRMLDVQRNNDVLVRAERQPGSAAVKRHDVEHTLAADPQLAVAVLVARAKLAENGPPAADCSG
jgi:carboxyl-terminal processing protease